MAGKKRNKKSLMDRMLANIWTYVIGSVIGLFGFYNLSGASWYHWVVNFVKRVGSGEDVQNLTLSAMAGVNPLVFTGLTLTFIIVTGLVLKWMFDALKSGEFDKVVFPLGIWGVMVLAVAVVAQVTNILPMTTFQTVEVFVIFAVALVIIIALATISIAAARNYKSINAAYSLIPLVGFVIEGGCLFSWFKMRGAEAMTAGLVFTSTQAIMIPILVIGYRLAITSRKASGIAVGTMNVHSMDQDVAEEMSDAQHSDHEMDSQEE